MIRRHITAAGAAAVLAIALAACGSGTATPSAASSSAASASAPASAPASASGSASAAVCAAGTGTGDAAVAAKGFAFNPATVSVAVGKSVTWTNGDTAQHSIVMDAGGCQADPFAGGATATLVFNVAGSYAYHCGIHPTMKGTVTVTG
jgi:plastocyanin